ncbi:uncharacterized protein LOC109859796 [Pseudomyrmex gracilis]|uniref:uncharacterized protein LOC109859796 n=1 Tax=Pseudomyrmex gracilis TaxID=219809 RepID=UPI000994ECC0|nr:uncharacterized protein LOC109859796 [Pseudomyrmex gracilis]
MTKSNSSSKNQKKPCKDRKAEKQPKKVTKRTGKIRPPMGTYRHIYENDSDPEVVEKMERFVKERNPSEEMVRGYYGTLQILRKYREPWEKEYLEQKKVQRSVDAKRSRKSIKYSPRSRKSRDDPNSDDDNQHVEERPKKKSKIQQRARPGKGKSNSDLKQKGKEVNTKAQKRQYDSIFEGKFDSDVIQTVRNFVKTKNPTRSEAFAKYLKVKYAPKKEERFVCAMEIAELSDESETATSSSQDTIRLSDMPEGELDDDSAACAERVSENYAIASAVLDRACAKPEINATMVGHKIKLLLDSDAKCNVISHDLCESLLQYPESVSLVAMSDVSSSDYEPARREIQTNFTVAGVNLRASFIVVENTSLLSAAVGRDLTNKIRKCAKMCSLFSGAENLEMEDKYTTLLEAGQMSDDSDIEEICQKIQETVQKKNEVKAQRDMLRDMLRTKLERERRERDRYMEECDRIRDMLSAEGAATPETLSESSPRAKSDSSVLVKRALKRTQTPVSCSRSEPTKARRKGMIDERSSLASIPTTSGGSCESSVKKRRRNREVSLL